MKKIYVVKKYQKFDQKEDVYFEKSIIKNENLYLEHVRSYLSKEEAWEKFYKWVTKTKPLTLHKKYFNQCAIVEGVIFTCELGELIQVTNIHFHQEFI